MTIDTTKPCVGRIYDYVLGGHNNFEVDRQEAEKILRHLPTYPVLARLNRWFLQMIAERWASEGFTQVLDFGSGMPTQGHFHMSMPEATVIYSDNDPMTIAYSEQVLADYPKAHYMLTDIRDIDMLLSSAAGLLNMAVPVGIGFIGVSYFVEDAYIRRIAQATHVWAAPGSQIALSYVEGKSSTPGHDEVSDRFRNMGSETYMRDETQIRELFAPWKVVELKPLDAWLHLEDVLKEQMQAQPQKTDAVMFGALLERGE